MKQIKLLNIFLIIISFGLGAYFYHQMPEQMASHWNIKGEVDGYMGKFWGVFLMPIVLLGIYLMFLLIPKIDPLKENYKKFRKYFDGFIFAISLFLFYIYGISIAWNLGYRFDINLFIIPAVAVIFYYTGVLIENAKQNWFVGIRTPWTLSSKKSWDKTHKLGGKLYKLSALFILMALLSDTLSFYFILIPIISVSLFLVAYSYFVYKDDK